MTEDPTTGGPAEGQDLPETGGPAPMPSGAPAPADPPAPDEADTQAEAELDELQKAKDEMLEMADQLARAKADIYNAEQRHNAYVQRSRNEMGEARKRGQEEVVEALIAVLDDIELARQHDELDGPFKSIAEKLEQTLEQNFAVARYGAAGEEFDPNIHEALMHNAKEGVETDVIDVVMQPGYRVGEKVVRPARVGVAGPA